MPQVTSCLAEGKSLNPAPSRPGVTDDFHMAPDTRDKKGRERQASRARPRPLFNNNTHPASPPPAMD
jgi:hypothetical protein